MITEETEAASAAAYRENAAVPQTGETFAPSEQAQAASGEAEAKEGSGENGGDEVPNA